MAAPVVPPPIDGDRPAEAPVRWAVFDGTGRLREKSWDIGPEDLETIRALVPADGHSHLSHEGRDGRRWRLALRRLRALPPNPDAEREEDDEEARPSRGEFAPGPASASLFLAAGEPLGPVEGSLRNVGLVLIGLSTGLWLLAAVAGRYYCRRALRPVAAMADAARSMTGWGRYYHLPSPGTGDELEGLAQSFNDLLDRLHHELERQTRFTGDASHQLRTPLTALIGELEVARRRDRSAEDYRQIIDEAHGEALRLREIIESLLFLARAEAEASCPDLRPIDLADWLPRHLRGWSARDRGRDIEADIADAPLRVRAHEPLLGQMLDNLLENAAKYSEPGTPIRVALRREGDVSRALGRGPGRRPGGRRAAARLRAVLPLAPRPAPRPPRRGPRPGGRPPDRRQLRRDRLGRGHLRPRQPVRGPLPRGRRVPGPFPGPRLLSPGAGRDGYPSEFRSSGGSRVGGRGPSEPGAWRRANPSPVRNEPNPRPDEPNPPADRTRAYAFRSPSCGPVLRSHPRGGMLPDNFKKVTPSDYRNSQLCKGFIV